ncbi:hypothetical protein CEXT_513851 [Caerostris extrusa]|uniref:RNase H type-1 domain-containing protein n=1 Tax=Caerostris extrusa TaxID=172846 RepID=A0AAV4UWE9_CAEEX|nr:hypothetical protein CEXT_513851 [Caerostris extrusa]
MNDFEYIVPVPAIESDSGRGSEIRLLKSRVQGECELIEGIENKPCHLPKEPLFVGLSPLTSECIDGPYGSKRNNQVGGAFVVYHQGQESYHHCFRLSDHATVFSDEQMAINKAVDYVLSNKLQSTKIISDLRSV